MLHIWQSNPVKSWIVFDNRESDLTLKSELRRPLNPPPDFRLNIDIILCLSADHTIQKRNYFDHRGQLDARIDCDLLLNTWPFPKINLPPPPPWLPMNIDTIVCLSTDTAPAAPTKFRNVCILKGWFSLFHCIFWKKCLHFLKVGIPSFVAFSEKKYLHF